MKNLTIEQKNLISQNTIKDSGVITFESYHSLDNTLVVTNINLNKMGSFYADRVYTLKHNGTKILVSTDAGEILDRYCEIMLSKLVIN